MRPPRADNSLVWCTPRGTPLRGATLLFALCAALLASTAAAAAAAAGAAPSLVTDAYQPAGYEAIGLAGAATVIAGSEDERANVIRAFTPGRPSTVLARVAPRAGESTIAGQVQLVSSASRLAVLDIGYIPGYKGSSGSRYPLLATGPLGSPLQEQTTGCPLAPAIDPSVPTLEEGLLPNYALALDGETLVYDSYGCLVVEDFSTGLRRILPLAATLDPVSGSHLVELPQAALLQVAGHLLAYRANPAGGEGEASVVVYDIETGTVLYSVPLPPLPPFEDGYRLTGATFALQADGTLVIASEPASESCQATISTPAHPAPVSLGVPACSIDGLNGGHALVTAPSGQNRMLAWTSLDDPALRPIAELGRHEALAASRPVTDGTNVAYALKSCWRPDVYMTPLTAPGSALPRPQRCPIAVVGGRASIVGDRVKVRISCPLGCEGELEASAGTPAQLGHGGAAMIARRSISVAPRRPTTLMLPSSDEQESFSEELAAVRALARRLRHKTDVELHLKLTAQALTVPASTRTVTLTSGAKG